MQASSYSCLINMAPACKNSVMPENLSHSTNSSDIDVWLTQYDSIADPALLARVGALMSSAERAQQQRFHLADDRLRYLVTRAMVRTVLSRYAPVSPAAWGFTSNPNGRPEIAVDHNTPGISFNISHSSGLIALVVSRRFTVGIDVENVILRHAPLEVARNFFAPAEAAELEALPQSLQHERFFEYWTLKESYIKARGVGLSMPLHCFSFSFPHPSAVSLAVDPGSDDLASQWRFWQSRPTPHHLLALCAGGIDETVPSVAVHSIVPTVSRKAVDMEWLRRPN